MASTKKRGGSGKFAAMEATAKTGTAAQPRNEHAAPPWTAKTTGWAAALLFATIAVFARCIGNDFVSWDDSINVINNPYLTPLNASNLAHFWQKPYENLYIPISYTLFALLASAARMPTADASITTTSALLDPRIFHAANLLLHAVNVLLVFAVLRRIVRRDAAAAVGALLFAVHPLQVESVAWISELRGLLSASFCLGAVLAYLNAVDGRDEPPAGVPVKIGFVLFVRMHAVPMAVLAGVLTMFPSIWLHLPAIITVLLLVKMAGTVVVCAWLLALLSNYGVPVRRPSYWLAIVLTVLALLSKPTAVSLPVLLFALDRWVVGRPLRACALSVLPWVLLAIPFVAVTHTAQPVPARDIVPLWQRPFVAGDALAFYLAKLFAPWKLTIDYGRRPGLVVSQAWGYATWLLPAAVAAAIWALRRNRPWLVAGGVVAVGALLPVLGLAPFVFQDYSTVADRYVYLAMFGPALIVASWLASTMRPRGPSPLEGDSESTPINGMAERPAAKRPSRTKSGAPAEDSLPEGVNAKYAYTAVAAVLILFAALSVVQIGRWRNSVTLFAYAVSVNPNSYGMHSDYALALSDSGNRDGAVQEYEKSIAIDPKNPAAYSDLGVVLLAQGKTDESIATLQHALALDPNFALAKRNLGVALLTGGRYGDAMANLQATAANDPQNPVVHSNYADALREAGQYADAVAEYQKALDLDPNLAEAAYGMGCTEAALGQLSDAERDCGRAVQLDPRDPQAIAEMGNILVQEGRYNDALNEFRQAVTLVPTRSLKPSSAALIYYNYGSALFNHGANADAQNEMEEAVRLEPSPTHYDGLGVVDASLGDKSAAITAFQESLKIDPNFAPARQHLAMVTQGAH